MKKIIVIVLAILLLSAGCGSASKTSNTDTNNTTPAQNQKAKEGESCSAAKTCEEGLKCISNVCSSGKLGSACATYKDCLTGLYCIKSVCSNPPSYTKYFNKVTISKMKPNMPPGPNNMPIPTTEFKTTDAIEIDLDVKPGITGTLYYELVNSTTGITEMSSANYKQKVRAGGWGTGFAVPTGVVGDFDLNVYYNDELVYTVPVKISQ